MNAIRNQFNRDTDELLVMIAVVATCIYVAFYWP